MACETDGYSAPLRRSTFSLSKRVEIWMGRGLDMSHHRPPPCNILSTTERQDPFAQQQSRSLCIKAAARHGYVHPIHCSLPDDEAVMLWLLVNMCSMNGLSVLCINRHRITPVHAKASRSKA
jgi:hypothetical protein